MLKNIEIVSDGKWENFVMLENKINVLIDEMLKFKKRIFNLILR